MHLTRYIPNCSGMQLPFRTVNIFRCPCTLPNREKRLNCSAPLPVRCATCSKNSALGRQRQFPRPAAHWIICDCWLKPIVRLPEAATKDPYELLFDAQTRVVSTFHRGRQAGDGTEYRVPPL